MLPKNLLSCWRRWLAEVKLWCGGVAQRLREATRLSSGARLLLAAAAGAVFGAVLALYLLAATTELGAAQGEPQARECQLCQRPLASYGGCEGLPALVAAQDSGSLCGPSAEGRGPHQKVVSFAFYGDVDNHRGYFKGIAENAALMASMYPGWVMRVYYELSPSENRSVVEALEHLRRRFANLDLCNAQDLPRYGNLSGHSQMLWRLLPAADPLVDVFVSRDLDSRLTKREATAVRHWMVSGLTFHVMRDNQQHHLPVMGGMWGAKPRQRRDVLRLVVDVVVACLWELTNNDQAVLAAFFWPLMKGDVLQHDSYYCNLPSLAGHGHMAPFPTKRKELDFVGNLEPSEGTNRLQAQPCTAACRPRTHPEWTYC